MFFFSFHNVISGLNNVTVSISPQNNVAVQLQVGVVFTAPVYTVTYTAPSSGVYLATVANKRLFFSPFFDSHKRKRRC